MVTPVSPKRLSLVASGLCLAGALLLSGCAAERPPRATTDWKRLLLPFRTARATADEIADPATDSLDAYAAPTAPLLQSTAPHQPDQYYNPRGAELPVPGRPFTPAPAPPAAEPGYLSDDSPSHNTTGVKAESGRPARLRDVFENFGRRQPAAPRPDIPLDEPVALTRAPSLMRVVCHEQADPVLLGSPQFE